MEGPSGESVQEKPERPEAYAAQRAEAYKAQEAWLIKQEGIENDIAVLESTINTGRALLADISTTLKLMTDEIERIDPVEIVSVALEEASGSGFLDVVKVIEVLTREIEGLTELMAQPQQEHTRVSAENTQFMNKVKNVLKNVPKLKKVSCQWGEECNNRDPGHRGSFLHPEDEGYEDTLHIMWKQKQILIAALNEIKAVQNPPTPAEFIDHVNQLDRLKNNLKSEKCRIQYPPVGEGGHQPVRRQFLRHEGRFTPGETSPKSKITPYKEDLIKQVNKNIMEYETAAFRATRVPVPGDNIMTDENNMDTFLKSFKDLSVELKGLPGMPYLIGRDITPASTEGYLINRRTYGEFIISDILPGKIVGHYIYAYLLNLLEGLTATDAPKGNKIVQSAFYYSQDSPHLYELAAMGSKEYTPQVGGNRRTKKRKTKKRRTNKRKTKKLKTRKRKTKKRKTRKRKTKKRKYV